MPGTHRTEPRHRIIDLTPELAEELLAKNPKNRKFSPANYATVRRAVERGEWVLNGEAIKVSENGYILDGQHRCRAVVETGITIRTLVVEGLPDTTQDTMDTGKSRSLADILAIHGESNTIGLAALIKKFVTSQRYGFASAFSGTVGGRALTNRECLDWFGQNQWARGYVMPGKAIGQATAIPASMASFLMTTFDNIDSEDSAYFWARVIDGTNLSSTSPIYVLRKTLKIIDDDSRGERSQRYMGAIVIKAWNAYRAGDEVGQLRFRAGGAKPEQFPEPK